MNKLTIDLEYLLFAWQDQSPDSSYYLDCETGSVILIRADLDDIDELRAEIELEPDRYLYIPKGDSEQLALDLSDFIYTLADEHLKSLLLVAYENPNKLKACEKLFAQSERALDNWKAWQRKLAKERVQKWLKAHDISPDDQSGK